VTLQVLRRYRLYREAERNATRNGVSRNRNATVTQQAQQQGMERE